MDNLLCSKINNRDIIDIAKYGTERNTSRYKDDIAKIRYRENPIRLLK